MCLSPGGLSVTVPPLPTPLSSCPDSACRLGPAPGEGGGRSDMILYYSPLVLDI